MFHHDTKHLKLKLKTDPHGDPNIYEFLSTAEHTLQDSWSLNKIGPRMDKNTEPFLKISSFWFGIA